MAAAVHYAEHIQPTLMAFGSTREIAAFAVGALDALGGGLRALGCHDHRLVAPALIG